MEKEQLQAIAKKFNAEIDLYERLTQEWYKRGDKVIERFLDNRRLTPNGADVVDDAKFNILWSNTETVFPAVYAKTPRPQASRRYQDRDPVGRVASLMLERCLEYELEQYSDYDSALKSSLLDRLLPGRGTAWIRYEPTFGQRAVQISEDNIQATTYDEASQTYLAAEQPAEPEMEEYTEHECAPVDYVNWKDFGHSFARTWEEVPTVWRRVYMTKGEMEDRFAEQAEQFGYKISDIPLDHMPSEVRNAGSTDEQEYEKKACIYEVWDKGKKRVYWLNTNVDKPLDMRDDPLNLDGFFPCPKPLYATTSTDKLVPTPDYCMYQDQARELDDVTNRIGMLQKALKIVGVYDATQKGVKRMLNEGVNNTLIPVDTWAAFAEKGGIKGTVDFLPLDSVVKALENLYVARESIKQVIYEVTGLSDIIRGSTDPNETLGAQQLKANYAGLRVRRLQSDVAHFARDMLRLKSEVICNFYSDETIVAMSMADSIPDVQKQPEILQAALQLLRDDVRRDFRIDIETDSMVELDEQAQKQSVTEMITALGTTLEKSVAIIQAVPELGAPIGETIMLLMRTFKAGKTIEGAWDDAIEKLMNKPATPPPPDPRLEVEKIKAQTAMQIEPIKAQAETMKAQASVQMAGLDLQKAAIEASRPPEATVQ